MAVWDKFTIDKAGKATVTTELDVLELPSGKYFLDMEFLKKLKNYIPEDLKNGSAYLIYKMVGHTEDGQSGITARITDSKTLSEIIKEIEENKFKKRD